MQHILLAPLLPLASKVPFLEKKRTWIYHLFYDEPRFAKLPYIEIIEGPALRALFILVLAANHPPVSTIG